MEPLSESLTFAAVKPGAVLETRAHTVTPEDVTRFSDLTFDHHPLHTDDAFARSMGFEQRIAHGLYGLSLMEGLKAELGLYTTTSIASLGWDKVRFLLPLYVGATVRCRVTFGSKRLSSKPGKGVVNELVELVDADEAVVISAEHATLLSVPAQRQDSRSGRGITPDKEPVSTREMDQ